MAAKKLFVNLPVKKLDKSKDFIPGRGWPYAAQTAAIATLTNIHCDPALSAAAPKNFERAVDS